MARTEVRGEQIKDASVSLTADVTGTLPVGNGGTGAATLTGLLVGNGTSAVTAVAAPSGTVVGTTDAQVQTNKTLSDTFIGEVFDARKLQRDTTLPASNDYAVVDVIEIGSTTSLEIPATSTLDVLAYFGTPSQGRRNLGVSGAMAVNVKDAPYNAVGNGVANDTAAFNAACTAAGVGGRVYVPPGTYVLQSVALNVAHQRWEFAPGAHMILPAGTADGKIVNITADYVTLDNGEWDGNRLNVSPPVYEAPITVAAAYCTVRDAYIHDTDGWGIVVHPFNATSTIDGTAIDNCTLIDTVQGGVTLDCITYVDATVSSSGVRVSGCRITTSVMPPAIYAGVQVVGGTTARILGAVVDNCHVYQPVANGALSGSQAPQGVFWRRVTGMRVTGCHVNGTDLGITHDVSTDSTISGCTVYGARSLAIELGGSIIRTTISGCVIDGNDVTQAAIVGDNNTNDEVAITGNTIGKLTKGATGGNGISMQSGGRAWTITDNVIRVPAYGILIYGASTTNVTVADNTIDMDSGGSQGFYCGIYLDPFTTGARGWTVKNNNLIGWTTRGILIDHATPLTASGIAIQGNTYTNTGTQVTLNNVTLDTTCQAETLSDTFIGEVFDAQKTQRDTVLLGSNDFTVMDILEVGAAAALEVPSTSTLEVLSYQPRARSGSTTVPGATFTLNTDLYDTYVFTNMGAALALTLTGNPRLGQTLMLGFKDDGTARAITYSANCVSSGVATLLATTVIGKQHWMGLRYDGSRWACLAVDATGY